MRDNGLQINFEYNYPDTAVLLVYETYGGGMLFGDSARIRIKKTLIGEDAIKMYSALTGKDIPSIHKEAGCPDKNSNVIHGTIDSEFVRSVKEATDEEIQEILGKKGEKDDRFNEVF